MGFLDNSSITVDAILTTRGREILSRGGNFDVTKFALSDEEIDYTMYDSTHPDGTYSFGLMIDNTSVLEAIPNRANLTSFLVNSSQIGSNIFLSQTDWTNLHWDTIFNIVPTTTGTAEEEAEDYTFTIQNINVVKFHRFYLSTDQPWQTVSDNTRIVVGRGVQFKSQSISLAATTTITVRGNVSEIIKVISITVIANPDANAVAKQSTSDVTDPKFY